MRGGGGAGEGGGEGPAGVGGGAGPGPRGQRRTGHQDHTTEQQTYKDQSRETNRRKPETIYFLKLKIDPFILKKLSASW